MDVAMGQGCVAKEKKAAKKSLDRRLEINNIIINRVRSGLHRRGESSNMRSKLGFAVSLVLALTLCAGSALAGSTAEKQNSNSSTTTTNTMTTTKSKRSKKARKHHKRSRAKRKSMKTGNANTRS